MTVLSGLYSKSPGFVHNSRPEGKDLPSPVRPTLRMKWSCSDTFSKLPELRKSFNQKWDANSGVLATTMMLWCRLESQVFIYPIVN